MSELKHTPGPWIVKTAINGDRAIVSEGIGIVAECFTAIRSFDEKTDEVIGNTAIMAASLELLEALEDLVELAAPNIYPQSDKPNSPWAKLQRARAAIAKAKA